VVYPPLEIGKRTGPSKHMMETFGADVLDRDKDGRMPLSFSGG